MKSDDVLLFADECSVRQAPTCLRMWALKGKTPVVKSPSGKERQQIIGALRSDTGEVISAFAKDLKAPAFIKFLKHLMRYYKAAGKIYLVVDNAKAHHAKIVQSFLNVVSHKLKVLFLPSYSPELNPIEHFWKYMRYKVTHNTYYEKFSELTTELRGFLVQHKLPSLEVQSRCPLP